MRTPAPPTPSEPTVPLLLSRDEPTSGGPKTQRLVVDTTPLPAILAGEFPRVRGYDILSVVGTGGMGIVYEARHRELNRRVAIKTLKGDALANPEFRERFRAEAEAIAKLQHPNVIQVFEVGTVEPTGDAPPSPFIALEFVDGGSLAAKARSPQVPGYAARTLATLARAAHAAHQLGVIHRDLKPANVLLSREGEPKIADFGIAKQIDPESGPQPLTQVGTVMGTPEYMSPEQLEGETVAPSIDVYALGVILYELLTGRVPFKGATFSDTMRLALNQEPVSPHRLQPGVPRDLETICLKCLEKQASKRYPTAAALADDLERWLDGRPIQARPLGPVGRTARWARRNPAVAALSALALVAGAAALGGLLWGWNEARVGEREAKRLMHESNTNEQRANEESAKYDAAAKEERWERYRLSLVAASGALRAHDVVAARRALDGAPGELREWVWGLLDAQLDRSRQVFGGPDDHVEVVAFSPNGRWLVLSDPNKKLTVWDLAAQQKFGPPAEHRAPRAVVTDGGLVAYQAPGHEIVVLDPRTGATRPLRGHTADLEAFQFANGDRELVSASVDHTVRVWDVATGRETSRFRVPDGTDLPLVLSPRGDVVGSRWAGTTSPTFWEVRTGRRIGTLDHSPFPTMGYEFSPDGTRIAASDAYPSTAVRLWDVASGKLLAILEGHENQAIDVEFSPDGTRIATSSLDRTVRVWDATAPPGKPGGVTRDALHVLEGHTNWIMRVAFSPDGTRVLSSARDRTLRYWDAKTGRQVAVLRGHSDAVHFGWFYTDSAGEPCVASYAADHTMRLWDRRAAENDYALRGHRSYAYSAGFFPDGARIASSAWDDTARIWDAYTGKQLRQFDHGGLGIVSSVAIQPGGKLIATLARMHGNPAAPGGVRLWDADTGELLHTWRLENCDYRDSRVAFSPDGKWLAAGAPDGRVRVWDVATRRATAVLEGHTGPVRDVAFSPDGKWLASGGSHGDGTVRVWDVATGKPVAAFLNATSNDCVFAVTWHPHKSLLAAASSDGGVRLWDIATGTRVGVLTHRTEVFGLAFNPDGSLLATGAADNLIRLWDVNKFREVAELGGHQMYVHHVAFDRDGTRLLSASGDKTVRVWDTDPQRVRTAPPNAGGP